MIQIPAKAWNPRAPAACAYYVETGIGGTPVLVEALDYEPASNQEAHCPPFSPVNLTAGGWTVDVFWFAGTGNSGDVDFGFSFCAEDSTVDIAQDSLTYEAEQTRTQAHAGSTASRPQKFTITDLTLPAGLTAAMSLYVRLRLLSTTTLSGSVRVKRVDFTWPEA